MVNNGEWGHGSTGPPGYRFEAGAPDAREGPSGRNYAVHGLTGPPGYQIEAVVPNPRLEEI